MAELTHLNAAGQVHMVEVGDRPPTRREATAEGFLVMQPQVLALVLEGRAPKGDVLAVARVAAMARPRRATLPLDHRPLNISLSCTELAKPSFHTWCGGSSRNRRCSSSTTVPAPA